MACSHQHRPLDLGVFHEAHGGLGTTTVSDDYGLQIDLHLVPGWGSVGLVSRVVGGVVSGMLGACAYRMKGSHTVSLAS